MRWERENRDPLSVFLVGRRSVFANVGLQVGFLIDPVSRGEEVPDGADHKEFNCAWSFVVVIDWCSD